MHIDVVAPGLFVGDDQSTYFELRLNAEGSFDKIDYVDPEDPNLLELSATVATPFMEAIAAGKKVEKQRVMM